ncbi:MAG: NAD(P)/FAD-dependent oxidoreductase [Candidatus Heimdallarchaeota archaeon]
MRDPSETMEVIVIGAGPAGLIAAYELGKQSINTVILEEHTKVGVPTSCAGLISISGLSRLGIRPPTSVILNRVQGARFYSPSGKIIKIERSTPQAYVVNRTGFDQYLAKRTKKEGAQILVGTRAIKIKLPNRDRAGYVEVLSYDLESESQTKSYAKICIDAEGCITRLLRQAGLSSPLKKNILPALQYEYQDVQDLDPTLVEVFTGLKIAPGFFAWMIPTGKDSVRVGLACNSSYSPRRLLENLIRDSPILNSRLRDAYRINQLGGRIPITGPVKKTYTDNFLVIGDAAGQIKPTTGGGVIVGGLCAQIAGKTAAKAIQLERYDAKMLSEYQQRWKSLLRKDLLAMKWARLFFNTLEDSDIDRLFKQLAPSPIISNIKDNADMDLQAKAIFTGLTQINLLDLFSLLPKAILSILKCI